MARRQNTVRKRSKIGETMRMLILRGVAGYYDNQNWPRGALYEEYALEFASRRNYDGEVLDVAGATGADSPQTKMTVERYRRDLTVSALYGFSGGGYNILHVISQLTQKEKYRLDLVVVLGAPKTPAGAYKASIHKGRWEVIYRHDPPGGHMDGPRALLASLPPPPPPYEEPGRRDYASGMPTGKF